MSNWAQAAPALSAAFLGGFVECVEAFTIVLAAASVRGWRVALTGAGAGVAALAALVATLGPLFTRIPLHALQGVVGVMLLLFGLRWLRKAILRAAGFIALHDETRAFARESEALRAHGQGADFVAGLAAFKGVLLEGVEVVFIVLAVGAGDGLLGPASLGALAAGLLVVALGASLRRPLSRVPENTMKLAVGVMLSAFGAFWTGEGLGVVWPGDDLAIPALAALFLAFAALASRALPRLAQTSA